MVDKKFRSILDVLKLLPTSTVIVYQMLNPIVTNAGACSAASRAATAALLVLCALTCAFSAFTDSFIGADGKVRYGLVTPGGLLPFGDDEGGRGDFSTYKLRRSDFANASLSVTVFAAVALLADSNTVACLYPSLLAQQNQLVVALPVIISTVASLVFTVFPSKRHDLPLQPAADHWPLASQ